MSQLSQQEVTDAIVKGGFHRYFASPQQAMGWPGINHLAKVLVENATLKATVASLEAKLASGGGAQVAQVAQATRETDPWASTIASVNQEQPIQPKQPTQQTIKRGGIVVEGVVEPESPFKGVKRQLNEQLPPPNVSFESENKDTTRIPATVVKGQNPNFLGSKVPPAPDPQEIAGSEELILDFGDGQPTPQKQSNAPSIQPLTADQIPADVMARLNAPFPQQHIPQTASMPVNMGNTAGAFLDGILDGV